MKKLKSVSAAVIFSVLAVIAGCSDQIISPLSQNSGPDKVTADVDKKVNVPTLHDKITLKPRQVVTFSSENTKFSSFNSVSVLNCADAKKHLEILGYLNDVVLVLGCNSKGFIANTITIENKSLYAIELDVFLTGILKMTEEPPVKTENEIF